MNGSPIKTVSVDAIFPCTLLHSLCPRFTVISFKKKYTSTFFNSMSVKFVSPLEHLNSPPKSIFQLNSDDTLPDTELTATNEEFTSAMMEFSPSILGTETSETSSTEQHLFKEAHLSSPIPFSMKTLAKIPGSQRKIDIRSPPRQHCSKKKQFIPPTGGPLPRVIKIHDPTDNEEDDEYFKSLVSTTVASPSMEDDSITAIEPSPLDPFKQTDKIEDTFVIVRIPPSENEPRIPEIVGVYPNTAEAFDLAYQSLRSPMIEFKFYEDDEADPKDASLRAFGVECDGSNVYVYKKTIRRSSRRAGKQRKQLFVVKRTYYGEYFRPDQDGEHEQNDVLGVFDTLDEANEAAPKLLEKDYEDKLREDDVEMEGWEEYEEEMLGNGSICINSEGRVAEYFHVVIGKEVFCEETGKRVSVPW